jgi:hypothetical protein
VISYLSVHKGTYRAMANVVPKSNALPVVSVVLMNWKLFVEISVVFMVNALRMACAVIKKKERRVGLHAVQLINPSVVMENAPLIVIKKIRALLPLYVQKKVVALKGVRQTSAGGNVVPLVPFV